MTAAAQHGESSPWAPLANRAFRWLWLGVLISSVGTNMQTVGAQWLLVDGPNAAALVSLVQAANTVPVVLLALPAGVVADSLDRRWFLFAVQGYFLVVGALLAGLTAAGRMPPTLLLVFTAALGAGVALQLPPWQAMIPDLVPRDQLRAAARLDLVSVNLARSVGPAVAGVVIARSGVAAVFALNAISVVFLAAALLAWRRPRTSTAVQRERFVPALRAGGRYVWHEPVVRRLMTRVALFVTPGMALWSLLPLIATQHLSLGPDGYGALFGALGTGAILGALVLGRVRAHLNTHQILATAGTLYAVTLAATVVVHGLAGALGVLVLAGLAWMAMTSILVAELQLVLPAWVRARGLGVYTVVFCGSQALGAIVWGLVAELAGLTAAVLLAALTVVLGVAAGVVWRMPEIGQVDPASAVYWAQAQLTIDPEPQAGPVLITVEYTVAPVHQAAFLEAAVELRRSRRRTGASRWELYRDGQRPDRFVESFQVPSWEEHLRQHDGRLTAADRAIENTVQALSDPPARSEHLLPP